MRPAATILLLILIALQVQLWSGNGSLTEVRHLRYTVAGQQQRNAELADINRELAADIASLKSGVEAAEELARNELAMTGKDETFYHIIELPRPAGPELPPPDARGQAP